MITLTPGKVRALQTTSTGDGVFKILAIDHRDSLRVLIDPDDPAGVPSNRLTELKLAIVDHIAPHATAVMLELLCTKGRLFWKEPPDDATPSAFILDHPHFVPSDGTDGSAVGAWEVLPDPAPSAQPQPINIPADNQDFGFAVSRTIIAGMWPPFSKVPAMVARTG